MLTRRPDHLRDHVSGPLDDDEVALADVLAVDVLLVVERGVRDGHAAHVDGLELRPRIERARAPDADVDLPQLRDGRRRRPLVRARPARALVQRAEPSLLVEVVDLDDDPVDLVVELGTPRLPGATRLRDLLDGLQPLGVRVGAEAVVAEPEEHLPLRLRELALAHAESVDPQRQRALGRDARVELAERAGCGVARVRRRLLPGRNLALVEAREPGEGEVDLASHLEQSGRRLAVGRSEAERDGVDRAQVLRHVLAAEPVAARGAPDERAVLVDERDGRAVDLRLDHIRDLLVGPEPLADVGGPLLERVGRGHLLERPHGLQVLHLGEARGGCASHPLRGRVRCHEPRMLVLEPLQLVVEGVEGAVRDLGVVEDVVTVVVVLDDPP
jgi:hypothetical protein